MKWPLQQSAGARTDHNHRIVVNKRASCWHLVSEFETFVVIVPRAEYITVHIASHTWNLMVSKYMLTGIDSYKLHT